MPPMKDFLVTKAFKETFRKERPDIIHAHDWMVYSILPLKKKYNIPFVLSFHGYDFLCPNVLFVRERKTCERPLTTQCLSCGVEKYKLPLAKLLPVYCALRMNRSNVKKIDKFIASHSFQKQIYLKYLGLKDQDICVIPQPVDVDSFCPSARTADEIREYEKKLRFESGAIKIVHVSRLWWDKMDAILNMIRATPSVIKEFPDAQVLLVGEGECLDYVYQLARGVNKQLNKTAIIVTGGIEAGDMPKIMRLADVVIGVGRVPLEAMACGKPVIVAGTIVGPLGGNYGGIVTPKNVAELQAHNFSGRNSSVVTSPRKMADDCTGLLANRKHMSSLGSFGIKYIKKEYDSKRIARRIEGVYHEVIECRE
jgi:glycosyltransferase involved in cell wall biosynthesis